MKQLSLTLCLCLLLVACGGGSSTGGVPDGEGLSSGGSVNETHRVSNFVDDENGDSVLSSNVAIDKAETWLLIESLTGSASDIDLEAIPEDDRFTAAFANTAFIAPGFMDALAALNSFYVCSEAIYAQNQCNWEQGYEESASKVETVIGSNQSYITTVSTRDDANSSLQQILVLKGTMGDLGNITFDLYEDGVISSSRVATRTANGTETVSWTSDNTNWVATETSDCTGSLEYEDISDESTVTVDAQWNLGSTKTTGSLDYQKVDGDGDESSITITW